MGSPDGPSGGKGAQNHGTRDEACHFWPPAEGRQPAAYESKYSGHSSGDGKEPAVSPVRYGLVYPALWGGLPGLPRLWLCPKPGGQPEDLYDHEPQRLPGPDGQRRCLLPPAQRQVPVFAAVWGLPGPPLAGPAAGRASGAGPALPGLRGGVCQAPRRIWGQGGRAAGARPGHGF